MQLIIFLIECLVAILLADYFTLLIYSALQKSAILTIISDTFDVSNRYARHVTMKLNDCIRNTTAVCHPRQNSVPDKTQPETKSSLRQVSVRETDFLLENFF